MHYFNKVKLGQKVFSIIYGKGTVIFTLPKEHRLDGFYVFAAQYSKKNRVYYTIDGFPNWSDKEFAYQSVFYKDDIDFADMDTQDVSKILSQKQILKYRDRSELEIQCPSGLWRNVDEVPESLMKKACNKSQFHLFRKETT